jgi:uncharacterized protein involved in exopolysaccharide biosynthesis
LELEGRTPERVFLADFFEIPQSADTAARNAKATKALKSGLVVSIDIEAGMVRFSLSTGDAAVSLAAASALIAAVNHFDLEKRTQQAQAEMDFAASRLKVLLAEATESEDRLGAFIAANRDFARSPELSIEYQRLQRDMTLRQGIYGVIRQAYEQSRLEVVRNTPLITVVDAPARATVPDSKKRSLKVVLGVIFGAGLGLALAFVLESVGTQRVYHALRRAFGRSIEVG